MRTQIAKRTAMMAAFLHRLTEVLLRMANKVLTRRKLAVDCST
jgi:hypothetical protein